MQFSFIEPMLLQAQPTLPEGWLYELKLDGYRAIAGRVGGAAHLRSRNDNDFAGTYPTITAALKSLPDDTVVDGEIVALDAQGRPSFNLLQHAKSKEVRIVFYVFDLLILGGKDVMGRPLRERRKLLETKVLPHLGDPFRLVQLSIKQFVDRHDGPAIRETFPVNLSLTGTLNEYSTGDREIEAANLFLTIDPTEAGYLVLGATLRILEEQHPQLFPQPASLPGKSSRVVDSGACR